MKCLEKEWVWMGEKWETDLLFRISGFGVGASCLVDWVNDHWYLEVTLTIGPLQVRLLIIQNEEGSIL